MRQRGPGAGQFVLLVGALLVWAWIALYVVFLNAADVQSDDMGLYNPIYMVQTTGHVSYPMQGQWESMTVHPPLHYFVAGLFARVWPSPIQAAGIMPALLALVACLTVVSGRFTTTAKLAILSGFSLAVLVFTFPNTIRPEFHVLFAWFAGVLLLEAARLDAWDPKKLFAGAAITAYASGLHYWALAANLALPVYAILSLISGGWRTAARTVAVMLVAWLCIWIPYSVLFVIPHFDEIRTMLNSAAPTSGILAAIDAHQHMLLPGAALGRWGELSGLGRLYLFPWDDLGIPLILVGIVVLAFSRSLRALMFGAAMLPLFVLLAVSRKAGFWYVYPEFTLYSIAVVWLLLSIARFIFRRGQVAIVAQAIVATVVVGISFYLSPLRTQGISWRNDDWQIARMADRRALGPDALVAVNQVTQWYTSGAARLLWYTRWGVSWNDMLADNASRFDSLVITDDWFANQSKAIPWPRFYLDRDVNLRTFYFYQPNEPVYCGRGDINQLGVSAKGGIPVTGHAYDRASRRMLEYNQNPDGRFALITFTGPLEGSTCPEALFSASFGLETWTDRLYAVLMDRSVWESVQEKYARTLSIRDVIFLDQAEISTDQLLNMPDSPMTFLRSPSDVR